MVPSTSASPSSQRGAIRNERGREAGLDRAAYDLLALGEEEPVLGLEVLAQLDVAQVAVVGEPGVGGVGDLDAGWPSGEVSRMGHRHHLADHDDRRRPHLVGRRGRRPASPSVESTVRSPGIVPSQTTATGVSSVAAAVDQRRRRSPAAFSTAIISTRVPRRPATAVPVDQRLRVAGRQVPGDHGELVRDAAVGDRDARPRPGTASGLVSPGITVTGTPASRQARTSS